MDYHGYLGFAGHGTGQRNVAVQVAHQILRDPAKFLCKTKNIQMKKLFSAKKKWRPPASAIFFFRRQKFQIQMFDAAKAKKNNGRASQRQSDDFYTFFFFIQMKCKEAPHLNNISHAKSQVKREGAKYANHLSDCKKIDWPFSAHLHMTGCGPWRPFVELKKRPFTARWPVKKSEKE